MLASNLPPGPSTFTAAKRPARLMSVVVDLANVRRTFGRYGREELARKLGDLVPLAHWTNYGAISEAVSVVLRGKVDKSGRSVGRALWYHPIKWQRIRHADGWFESSAREKTAEQKHLMELEQDRAHEREGGTLVLTGPGAERRAAASDAGDAPATNRRNDSTLSRVIPSAPSCPGRSGPAHGP